MNSIKRRFAAGREDAMERSHSLKLPVLWAALTLFVTGTVGTAGQTSATATPPKQRTGNGAAMVSEPAAGMLGRKSVALLQSPKAGDLPASSPTTASDVEHMSHEQFRALPDTAIVRYRGQSMSKAAFIQQRLKEWRATGSLPAGRQVSSFERLRTEFEQKQASDLQAQNARVQAVIDRINRELQQLHSSPRYMALLKEAGEISRRYASADPSEKPALKSRALQIHQELTRLERIE